jgi:ribosomal protein S6--L-glutamate ligase
LRPLSALAGRRLELWVEARDGGPAVNPVLHALLQDLAETGADLRVRVPEAEIVAAGGPSRGERPDLVLLKTPGALALALASAVEASGVPCLNPAPATLRAQDKGATVARLAAAGLPVPATFLSAGSDPGAESSASAVDRSVAWVSKPTRGVHGYGVAFHESFREALEHREASRPAGEGGYVTDEGTRLVQRRVGAGEPDVKVYVAGGEVFAGAKPFGPRSYREDAITPYPLPAAQRELVLAAGEALGLRLFGVDLRTGAGGPALVDVNPFPGYRGFPDAVPALRREVQRALREAGR